MFRSQLRRHRNSSERDSSLLSDSGHILDFSRDNEVMRKHLTQKIHRSLAFTCHHHRCASSRAIVHPFYSPSTLFPRDVSFPAGARDFGRINRHEPGTENTRLLPPFFLFLFLLWLFVFIEGRVRFSPAPRPCVFSRLEGTRAGGGRKFRTNLHVALLTISSFEKKTRASSRLSIKEVTLNNISSLPCEILSIMPIADL